MLVFGCAVTGVRELTSTNWTPSGLTRRYVTVAAPFLATLYVTWLMYTPVQIRRPASIWLRMLRTSRFGKLGPSGETQIAISTQADILVR